MVRVPLRFGGGVRTLSEAIWNECNISVSNHSARHGIDQDMAMTQEKTQQQASRENGNALDKLVALVEKAGRAIETLQATNAAQAARIAELESSIAALKDDAEWSRWFRAKYGASTFYTYIEREHRSEHAVETVAANTSLAA
jgi:cell division protein FtsB